MSNVDLFLPAAPKDYAKIPFVLGTVNQYLFDIKAAHVVTPDGVDIKGIYRFPVYSHCDQDVLDIDYQRFAFRPKWVYQQFLKLFQTVTADWYLALDADRFLNIPLNCFEGERPVMFLSSNDQNHAAYFDYNRAMLGIDRVYPHSFLSEMTLYHRPLINSLLAAAGMTREEWIEKSYSLITALCCIGDAELYGNFVYSQYPDFYCYRVLRDSLQGKYNGGWNAEEIMRLIDEMKQRQDVEIYTAHSWHD